MTPTEKKYAQHIGKLYWASQRVYNHDKQDYDQVFDIVMPVGLRRRNDAGRYLFTLQVVQFGDMPNNQPRGSYLARQEYDMEAGYFLHLFNKVNEWCQGYFPVVTGEIQKDVAKIPQAKREIL